MNSRPFNKSENIQALTRNSQNIWVIRVIRCGWLDQFSLSAQYTRLNNTIRIDRYQSELNAAYNSVCISREKCVSRKFLKIKLEYTLFYIA